MNREFRFPNSVLTIGNRRISSPTKRFIYRGLAAERTFPFLSLPGAPLKVARPCEFHMACCSHRITVASPTLSLITESINKRIHFLHRIACTTLFHSCNWKLFCVILAFCLCALDLARSSCCFADGQRHIDFLDHETRLGRQTLCKVDCRKLTLWYYWLPFIKRLFDPPYILRVHPTLRVPYLPGVLAARSSHKEHSAFLNGAPCLAFKRRHFQRLETLSYDRYFPQVRNRTRQTIKIIGDGRAASGNDICSRRGG